MTLNQSSQLHTDMPGIFSRSTEFLAKQHTTCHWIGYAANEGEEIIDILPLQVLTVYRGL